MTDTPGALPPAGWYPDPYGAPLERWWDGAQWTDHTNVPAAPEPPVAEPEPEPIAPAEPTAPVWPGQEETAQSYAAPQEYVAPQEYTAPQEYVAPQEYTAPQEYVAPQEYTAPQEYVAPQEYTAPQQYTAPQEYVAPPEQAAEPVPSASWSLSPEPQAEQPVAPELQEPQRGEQPWYDAPSFEQMSFTQPGYSAASYDAPTYEAPTYESPAAEVPAYEVPAYEAPAYQPQGYAAPAEPVAVPLAAAPVDASFDFGRLVSGEGVAQGDGAYWSNDDFEEPATNAAATAGVAFGVLSFILPAIGALLGLVFSVLGLLRSNRLAKEGEGPIGRTKSIVGIALSVIGGVVSAALVLWALQTFVAPDETTTDGGEVDNGVTLYDQPALTEGGTIPLAIGEAGVIRFSSTNEPALQFSVTGITSLTECTADDGSVLTPDNGQFLAVTVDLTTAADYVSVMTTGVPLRVSMSDWLGQQADGTVIPNSDVASSCVGETTLPDEIPAGEKVSGVIFVDTAAGTPGLSFSPANVSGIDQQSVRWEWPVA